MSEARDMLAEGFGVLSDPDVLGHRLSRGDGLCFPALITQVPLDRTKGAGLEEAVATEIVFHRSDRTDWLDLKVGDVVTDLDTGAQYRITQYRDNRASPTITMVCEAS